MKNSVYMLPARESCQEDFQWIAREIKADGGEATLLRAQVVEGLQWDDVKALFNTERERDYRELVDLSRSLLAQVEAELAANAGVATPTQETELARLERRLADIEERDFFGAPGREAVSALLLQARNHLTPPSTPLVPPRSPLSDYKKRTWVTRRHVRVDRIASAWLIRKYIDSEATFKFVGSKDYKASPGEVCFDMFEAEFTHAGNACTFEVLCSRFELGHAGLAAIAELVHDLDIKDDRYNRPETPGFAAQIEGITLLTDDDETRITHGTAVLDALESYFANKARS